MALRVSTEKRQDIVLQKYHLPDGADASLLVLASCFALGKDCCIPSSPWPILKSRFDLLLVMREDSRTLTTANTSSISWFASLPKFMLFSCQIQVEIFWALTRRGIF